ncbi:MAG: RsmE family RNA methyltransferase, partial [Nitriliruptoraceae bacterium]
MSRPAPFLVVGDLSGASAGVRFTVEPDERHHLRRVLRVADGDAVVATDGNGRSASAVVRGDDVELVDDVVVSEGPRPRVTVWQALPKGRKVDDVARVLTELAIDELVIVAAHRSVADRTDRAERMQARIDAVVRAAARQSRNPRLPSVRGPAAVSDLSSSAGACVLIADPAAAPRP